MAVRSPSAATGPPPYRRRRPERTLLWDLPAAGPGGGDACADPAPEYDFDQRFVW